MGSGISGARGDVWWVFSLGRRDDGGCICEVLGVVGTGGCKGGEGGEEEGLGSLGKVHGNVG